MRGSGALDQIGVQQSATPSAQHDTGTGQGPPIHVCAVPIAWSFLILRGVP